MCTIFNALLVPVELAVVLVIYQTIGVELAEASQSYALTSHNGPLPVQPVSPEKLSESQPVLLGPPSTENGIHYIEKLRLK